MSTQITEDHSHKYYFVWYVITLIAAFLTSITGVVLHLTNIGVEDKLPGTLMFISTALFIATAVNRVDMNRTEEVIPEIINNTDI